MDTLVIAPNIESVIRYLKLLQQQCCDSFQALDPKMPILEDRWQHPGGGGGITRVIQNGAVFEKGGVNFSHVKGDRLPDSALVSRSGVAGKPFQATGVSLVVHPRNPFVPTSHMNVRYFVADPESENPVWWFGGGYDLTPYYGFDEDCVHWHQIAKAACAKIGPSYYDDFKAQCDQYFYLKHRNEPRGIGGIFFDDFNDRGFESSFALMQNVGSSFIEAYMPIVEKRMTMKYNKDHQKFQQYRRGRYVEFNLIYDRGTLFGLQSQGRVESILMSMPPVANWRYNWNPKAGSEEEKLMSYYLKSRDWAGLEI